MTENKWVEIITLRLSDSDERQAILDIFDQVNHGKVQLPSSSGHPELYANTDIETDWSIHLKWQRQGKHPSKTIIGLSIAEAFRSLGLVNHSIWNKKKSVEKEMNNETI